MLLFNQLKDCFACHTAILHSAASLSDTTEFFCQQAVHLAFLTSSVSFRVTSHAGCRHFQYDDERWRCPASVSSPYFDFAYAAKVRKTGRAAAPKASVGWRLWADLALDKPQWDFGARKVSLKYSTTEFTARESSMPFLQAKPTSIEGMS